MFVGNGGVDLYSGAYEIPNNGISSIFCSIPIPYKQPANLPSHAPELIAEHCHSLEGGMAISFALGNGADFCSVCMPKAAPRWILKILYAPTYLAPKELWYHGILKSCRIFVTRVCTGELCFIFCLVVLRRQSRDDLLCLKQLTSAFGLSALGFDIMIAFSAFG